MHNAIFPQRLIKSYTKTKIFHQSALFGHLSVRQPEALPSRCQWKVSTTQKRWKGRHPHTHTHTLQHCGLSHRTFTPPHVKLTCADAAAWRHLRTTDTFPSLTLCHNFYPTHYRDLYSFCREHPSLHHSTWERPKLPGQPRIPNSSPSQWTAALSSTTLDDQ